MATKERYLIVLNLHSLFQLFRPILAVASSSLELEASHGPIGMLTLGL